MLPDLKEGCFPEMGWDLQSMRFDAWKRPQSFSGIPTLGLSYEQLSNRIFVDEAFESCVQRSPPFFLMSRERPTDQPTSWLQYSD